MASNVGHMEILFDPAGQGENASPGTGSVAEAPAAHALKRLEKHKAEGLERDRHLDHKTPRSRGGKSEMENYQYLCPPCNMAKGARTVEEYLEHCRRVLLFNGKWWE